MGILLIGFAEDYFDDEQKRAIHAAADGLEVVYKGGADRRLDEVEVALENRKLIPDLPNLRWLQQWGAGADWLMDHPELAERDFVLTNVSGIHAVPISEHILAYLLAFARELPRFVRNQTTRTWKRGAEWPETPSGPLELAGKTMLLLGVGAIGARTAKLADALEMRVVGVRRNPERAAEHVHEMVALSDLHRALPNADFVVLTLPLTRDTYHLIGEKELRAMKDAAVLVNIGRGGLVDERALARALQEGRIAGAGLDVFETEPLPERSPLWEMENVIITPHTAGDTPHYTRRALDIFLDNLRRYHAGEPLTHVVDKTLGY